MAAGLDICILGLGASGRAAAEYAAERIGTEFGSVTAFDSGDGEAMQSTAAALRARGVRVELGPGCESGTFDLCVASPGIPPAAPLFVWAQGACARMISEIEFAYERSVSPWAAVTGTNGKTTTTSLLAHLLEVGGVPTRTVGNIGAPAIRAVESATPGMVLVAEVSSFQLALTERFHPRVGVLLNITPDHIEWHGSLGAYTEDKTKIFANLGPEDTAVIDIDDPGSAVWAQSLTQRGVRVCAVSRSSVPVGGAGLIDGLALGLDTHAGVVEIASVTDLRIRGDHNVSNALAAAAAAHALGVPLKHLHEGLMTFEPIEHRLEPVGVVHDVEYFNDSKATNPDAVLKALTAFDERPLVVLLGGRTDASTDFTELADKVAESAKAVVVFGEARHQLGAAFESRSAGENEEFEFVSAVCMADAVAAAAQIARSGDAVLLSPACKSFDEFTDYTERGRAFKSLVEGMSGRGDE